MNNQEIRKPWAWGLLALSCIILNAIDGVLTYAQLTVGVLEESNPFMATLFDIYPPLFFFVKVAGGTIMLMMLLERRDNPLARYGLIALLVIYAQAVLTHFGGWFQILG